MNAFDWQAYVDGSLSADQLNEANEALRKDPKAQSDFAAFEDYRRAVLEAGQAERVPLRRLEDKLSQVSSKRTPWLRMATIGAPLAAAAVIWMAIAFDFARFLDPLRLDHSPTRATLASSDPVVAANWVKQKTGFVTPIVNLAPQAGLAVTRHGDNWACYDYDVDGKTYFLYMSPNESARVEANAIILPNGRTVSQGRGLRWRQGKMCFYIRGPDDKVEQQLAMLAMKTIDQQTTGAAPSAYRANQNSSSPAI